MIGRLMEEVRGRSFSTPPTPRPERQATGAEKDRWLPPLYLKVTAAHCLGLLICNLAANSDLLLRVCEVRMSDGQSRGTLCSSLPGERC